MSNSTQAKIAIALAILCAVLTANTPTAGQEISEATRIVNQAKFDAIEIPLQAEALVRLAWFDDQGNSEAAALARDELVKFGKQSLAALHSALNSVEPRYTADIVAVLAEAKRLMAAGSPAEYIAALEHALWVGSVDAKRLAIKEITRFNFRAAMLPIIDAAIEYPTLTRQVIDSLEQLGDARARFYLDRQVREGSPAIRVQAAECLATIGGDAIQPLRELTYSDDVEIRHIAIQALLPRTTLNDLTILHEYIYMHPEDDPEILAVVRDRAMLLETLLDQGMETGPEQLTSPVD
jgi:hypothetical protein